MEKLSKVLILIVIVYMIFSILIGSNLTVEIINTSVITRNPIKVAVVVFDIDDLYVSEIVKSLKDIPKENEEKVEFTFFSSNKDKNTENQILDTIFKNKEFDLLLIDLVDINAVQEIMNKIKENNSPVILFHREPYKKDAIQSYEKSILVASYPEQAGVFQGEILVNEWNKNKSHIDRNKDDIMQYVILKGKSESLDTINRTKYSVSTIKNSGIKIEELASQFANWDKEEAQNMTDSLLLRYGNKIEVIIANNDAMAIGAIKALQSRGYNNGDKEKTIPVVGVDAVPEARELIKKGFMTGTVIQDARGMADAIYSCGINLVKGKSPLDGTKYEFDDSGVTIRIPYQPYVPS